MKRSELVGFVVRRRNYRDSDRIVTIFSKQQGKSSFIAKGVRKSKAKLTPFLEPLVESRFQTLGSGSLPVLVGAHNLAKNNFYDSPMDRRLPAAVITELLELVALEGQKNEDLYGVYKSCLKTLHQTPKPILMLDYFVVKIMSIAGIEPYIELSTNKGIFFDYDEGIISGRQGTSNSIPISYDCAKLWKAMDSYDLATIGRLKVNASLVGELLATLIGYLEYHFSRKIKSAKILFEMDELLQPGS